MFLVAASLQHVCSCAGSLLVWLLNCLAETWSSLDFLAFLLCIVLLVLRINNRWEMNSSISNNNNDGLFILQNLIVELWHGNSENKMVSIKLRGKWRIQFHAVARCGFAVPTVTTYHHIIHAHLITDCSLFVILKKKACMLVAHKNTVSNCIVRFSFFNTVLRVARCFHFLDVILDVCFAVRSVSDRFCSFFFSYDVLSVDLFAYACPVSTR